MLSHEIFNNSILFSKSRTPITFLLTLFVLLNFSVYQAASRGGAVTRGSGGARGTQRKPDDTEDTGTLGVILVVILPVAQMIAVLVVIVLLRMCYLKYCGDLNTDSVGPVPDKPINQRASLTNNISNKHIPSQY